MADEVDETHLVPTAFRREEDDGVPGPVPAQRTPQAERHERGSANASSAPPRPGRRGGDADRQCDRYHEAIRSREGRSRREHACQHVVVFLDEDERPDRCREKDRRRIDHREDEGGGEQRQGPHGEPRCII